MAKSPPPATDNAAPLEVDIAGGIYPDLAPARSLYVVGDVHGRAELLDILMDKIAAERDATKSDLVFVGDLVDRGERAARVLSDVKKYTNDINMNVVCLMGNHERMLLDFMENPLEHGARWLNYGGLQTLMSYGVRGPTSTSDIDALLDTRDALRAAMKGEMEEWLINLPLRFDSGNVTVVHAAADPALPMDSQDDKTLLWGHHDFQKKTRTDGQWVVHGHTIVDLPTAGHGRINTDTGAYATGRLTCAVIETGTVRFIST